MVRALGLVVLLALLGSCEADSCTAIGCLDSASITIKTANGEWAAGEYTLAVTLDGVEHACSFTMPDDLPSGVGQWGEFECEPPQLSASFVPRVMCTEHVQGGSSSQTCTPIPNQFDIEVSVHDTPATGDVELALGGTVLVDEAHPFEYQQSFPNGPECGPACNQAKLTLQIP